MPVRRSVPVSATEYFVSYAWGDDTSAEGKEREKIVDDLCVAAEGRGVRILRDKTTLKTGELISAFMRRIGSGDRVFVILSDKYLHSDFCMTELCEIWRYSRAGPGDFRRRVRIYALADTKAGTILERMRLSVWWKSKYDEISAMIKEHGPDIMVPRDLAAFRRMGEFYRVVPDILALMFDTVQPRTFEELVAHGFGADGGV
jgi:internalin A